MVALRSAVEQDEILRRPVPAGLWRWSIVEVKLARSDKFANYQVKLTLDLTEAEQTRLIEEYGPPPAGVQQGSRTWTSAGLSLGYWKDKQYRATRLVDFLAACFGSSNQARFREWISQGGGPVGQDPDTEAGYAAITSWLGWWQELEVYGSITHEPDRENPAKLWPRFGGALPVGSLPGQKDDQYQAFGRGKLRAMLAESGSVMGKDGPALTVTAADGTPVDLRTGGRPYEQVFGNDDAPPKPMPQAVAVAEAHQAMVAAATHGAVAPAQPPVPDDDGDLPF